VAEALLFAALLIAQATAMPSAGHGQTPAVSFADGLQRLINHAEDRFLQDRGPEIAANGDTQTYALNFAVAGLAACRVLRHGDMGNVTCDAYRGSDAVLAQATFNGLAQRLRVFAGKGGRFSVDSFSLTTERVTIATYWPSEAVDVAVEKHESKGVYSVVFRVARNPS